MDESSGPRGGGFAGIGRTGRRSRRTLYVVSCLVPLVWICLPVLLAVPDRPDTLLLAGVVVAAASALAGAGIGAVRQALEFSLRRGPAPWTHVHLCGAMLALLMAAFVGFDALVGLDDSAARTALLFAPVPFATPLAMTVPVRVFALVSGAATLMGAALLAVAGEPGSYVASAAVIMLTGFALAACVGRFGAWSLALMWQLRRAEDAGLRLAAAEERLRFGLGLQDAMGRKLTVMAHKSEQAVQMARRGRPEAVDQMVEVQRLAQDARGEAHELGHGHRKAGLRDELLTAVGVLEASGVRCGVIGADLPELPGDVQSALGRVVRKGTADVLRDGNSRWCEITLEVTGEPGRRRAVLTVEHDGDPAETPGTAGSRLAGLRERLAPLDGTLRTESVEGTSRLTAEVPLEEVTA
ncbi:sensor histidine kinase [Streptomyces althioticus]|uniref:Sensor histidine kinase n=1 Tax=Streptomyces althioticus TaxID=83380 RepID=A0ABZ1Y0S8_9ACTN